MAYEYRIIADHDLILIEGSGAVSSDDIRRVVTAFQRDPAWHPAMKMLVDWRRIDDLLIELDEVQQLAKEALGPEQMDLGTPLGTAAAVVLSDHSHVTVPMLYYGYLRKSQLTAKIFFQMDEALAWLGASPDALSGNEA